LIQVPDDVESAAEQLRKEWHLGEDPLASTIEISEGNEVKVVEVDSSKEFDGLSGQANSRPVIVLAKWLKDDLSRKRLTILHEIGHLLLRFSSAIDEKTEEKICYRFAGAMLIPRKVFEKEFGGVRRQVWLEELLDIKLRYGISLAAIVQRALDLKLIDQDQYRIFKSTEAQEDGVRMSQVVMWAESFLRDSSNSYCVQPQRNTSVCPKPLLC